MSLRKLDDNKVWKIEKCISPEHDPPNMMSLPPGTYEWTCPVCGKKQIFVINGVFM